MLPYPTHLRSFAKNIDETKKRIDTAISLCYNH